MTLCHQEYSRRSKTCINRRTVAQCESHCVTTENLPGTPYRLIWLGQNFETNPFEIQEMYLDFHKSNGSVGI